MILHGTSRINHKGHLEIGGCDTVQLAKEFGTPLYVIDESFVRDQMRRFRRAAEQVDFPFQVAYASKAFSTLAMCRLVDEEGLLLDVVSEGELYTALKADFPADRIYFHGNNKTLDECRLAVDAKIRCFVVDNFVEIQMLQQLAEEKNQTVSVILRVAPGVEAHTHAYIQTGQQDSKFGFDLASGQVMDAVQQVFESTHLELEGFHCHIGSQIFEVKAFQLTVEKMAQLVKQCQRQFSFQTKVLNIGGGFGIRYEAKDQPISIEEYVNGIADAVIEHFQGETIPEIWIEPGRKMIGEAGTTLYTIGSMKEIPHVRNYLSVDGGMTDNLRPALYDAKYEAILANRAKEQPEKIFTIAGKCCESGDILIWDCPLPDVKTGDLLAVNCTGAYTYSMASNYNRLRRPAVVFVRDGQADLVVERESLEDLIVNDRIPARLQKTPSISRS